MNKRNRKSNRLQNYDYSQAGYYFVTICTQNRVNYLGEIERAQMELSHIGQIVTNCWRAIPEHFHDTALDEFVAMPNHIHGIIVIKSNDLLRNDDDNVGNDDDNVGNNDRCSLRVRNMQLLPKIISQYKSSVTRIVRKQSIEHPFRWQKSFYDHIIRDEKSLNTIRTYIQNNPLNWELDEDNPQNWQVGEDLFCKGGPKGQHQSSPAGV